MQSNFIFRTYFTIERARCKLQKKLATSSREILDPLDSKELTMARVVRFHEIGGPEVLRIENVEIPPPGKGEVQIRIQALGLNRAEVMFRPGQYVSSPKFPARPGYEAAGTIAAIGEGVRGFKIGDAVSVIPGFDLNDYG